MLHQKSAEENQARKGGTVGNRERVSRALQIGLAQAEVGHYIGIGPGCRPGPESAAVEGQTVGAVKEDGTTGGGAPCGAMDVSTTKMVKLLASD